MLRIEPRRLQKLPSSAEVENGTRIFFLCVHSAPFLRLRLRFRSAVFFEVDSNQRPPRRDKTKERPSHHSALDRLAISTPNS
jgi:hypothetical protein